MATSREPVRLALRKLWSDHVIWTREYIVAAVAGTPDADAAAGRLLKNQEDIGAAIAGYYGDAAGDRLTELLKEHILIAVDLVAAAKSGDTAAFATHDARWTANIEAIATFLAGANPNWPEKRRPRPAGAAPQAHQGRGRRADHRRLGCRRQGVRRHLHRDHGPRRRPPRRDRRAVPGALRGDGGGMTALELSEAPADPATPPDRRRAVRRSRGCWRTDGRRHGFVGLRATRCDRPDLLVEPVPDGQGLRPSG